MRNDEAAPTMSLHEKTHPVNTYRISLNSLLQRLFRNKWVRNLNFNLSYPNGTCKRKFLNIFQRFLDVILIFMYTEAFSN